MIRAWLGIAILAASWLPGLGYYEPANPLLWLAMVVLGTALLDASDLRLPRRTLSLGALALVVPGLALTPWPYKAAPLLLAVGLGLLLAPIPRRWPETLGRKALAGAAVLAAQGVTVLVYARQTARSHDLPEPLTAVLGWIAQGLGADVAAGGGTLAIAAAGRVHRFGATWDLLLDPATLGFLVGGLVLLALTRPDAADVDRPWANWLGWLRSARAFALVVLAWLPFRVALVLGILLQRTLRADTSVPLAVMNQFTSWWMATLLLAGPVLLAARFVCRRDMRDSRNITAEKATEAWRPAAVAVALVLLGMGVLAAAWAWDPIGSPKSGRVMVVERNSQWEPTTTPYDVNSFGEATSYTYRLIYNYAARRFDMSRLLPTEPLDAETLGRCDVLVLKTPTARFSPDEVKAIERFVRAGGGLLLIGDHTNVFRSSTHLNDVARQFGFTFRDDLLFRVGTPYEQPYRRPWAPHPSVEHVDAMDFAVSCSIDPGDSLGTAAIQSPGLWSLPAEYHVGNYHPPAEYRSQMRLGPFVQLWATRHGKGRILAFGDSTIFSSFCIFQPGKSELMLNMIQWLNYRSRWDDRWLWMGLVIPAVLVGLGLVAAGVRFARRETAAWVLLLAAGLLGWTGSCTLVTTMARHAMPEPRDCPDFRLSENGTVPLDAPGRASRRDAVDVVIDRTVSDVPLSKGAFTQGDGAGFGLLEQWIPRLGYFTSRRQGPDVFSGDALVVLCPTGSISPEYGERLVEYVSGGGKLVVFDAPYNRGSTANSLLRPFSLAMDHETTPNGELTVGKDAAGIKVDAACQVIGGQTIATIGGVPVATRLSHGTGTVTAIGLATTFNDAAMGEHWMQVPDATLRKRYDVLFGLLRSAVEGR
jgi:hypothetical protein